MVYRGIAEIAGVMRKTEPLRFGRMYLRAISVNAHDFCMPYGSDYTLAFSRILYPREVLVAYNVSRQPRSDFVVVAANSQGRRPNEFSSSEGEEPVADPIDAGWLSRGAASARRTGVRGAGMSAEWRFFRYQSLSLQIDPAVSAYEQYTRDGTMHLRQEPSRCVEPLADGGFQRIPFIASLPSRRWKQISKRPRRLRTRLG